MRGGKCWFAIESKSFEVSVEEVRGKLKGTIVDRSRGFSSWIRFGDLSLRNLLEGFEECCRKEKEGRWGDGSVVELELDSLRKWEERFWNLKKDMKVMKLGGTFFLLEFEDEEEAERVLKRGMRHYKDKLLHLSAGEGKGDGDKTAKIIDGLLGFEKGNGEKEGGQGSALREDERCRPILFGRQDSSVRQRSGIRIQIRKGSEEVEGAPGKVSPTEPCLMEEASRILRRVMGSFLIREGKDGKAKEEREMWSHGDNCLAKFYHCLGMPAEGFEGEILKLLNRMKERRERFERVSGKKRKGQRSFRFDRELKKLEYSGCGDVVFGQQGVTNGGDGGGQIFSLLSLQELMWSEPWCIAGDFNMIRFPSEHSRGGRLFSAMRRFSEVIEELELRDLPLQGGLFTWSGGFNNRLKLELISFSFLKIGKFIFRGAFKLFWLSRF
ncbi:hypothetical protein CK203_056854 [Vitis vinifera]|uniref:DUF4283 domain-containing protein n=1 Tax=Vitis vinifera TaxID=29760 RepID=A0A438GQ74_VITVI|nr:hypothetical protein CK203_056854 [Vitis vinifera]